MSAQSNVASEVKSWDDDSKAFIAVTADMTQGLVYRALAAEQPWCGSGEYIYPGKLFIILRVFTVIHCIPHMISLHIHL